MRKVDAGRFGPWAVVTGASSGIGKEFARQLAASGLNVVLVARRQHLLEENGRQLRGDFGIAYRTVAVDLGRGDFLDAVQAATRGLDVGLLVSNAGSGRPGRFLEMAESELLERLQVNAISHLRLAHHFGRQMAFRRHGGIVLVSAMGAPHGIPYLAADGAAKACVFSLGRALNHELKGAGINVSVLVPTAVDTPVIAALGFDMVRLPAKPMPVEACVDDALAALASNRPSRLAGRLFRIIDALAPARLKTGMNARLLGAVLAAREASR